MVMRITKLIKKRENALILNQILSTILKRNVWRSVWRICMWILGPKGLTKYEFTNFAGLHSVSWPAVRCTWWILEVRVSYCVQRQLQCTCFVFYCLQTWFVFWLTKCIALILILAPRKILSIPLHITACTNPFLLNMLEIIWWKFFETLTPSHKIGHHSPTQA